MKRSRYFFALLVLLLFLISSATTKSAAYRDSQGETRYTTARVVLREGPSTEAEPLVVIPRGVPVEVSCRNSWCATYYGGMSGFVFERLLATQRPSLQAVPAREQRRTCCKICSRGQACGNSCISRAYTCHQPPGCACNG